MFSFFRSSPSFDKVYAAGIEAANRQDVPGAIEKLTSAVRVAGSDHDKAGAAMFTLGEVIIQMGQVEQGRVFVAQGYTMLGVDRRTRHHIKVMALLGMPSSTPPDEALSACWELDAKDKLRHDDAPGCLTALLAATAALADKDGADNARMVPPMWRTMARMAGTAWASLAPMIDEIADRALAIVAGGGVPVDDALQVLSYKARAQLALGNVEEAGAYVERVVSLAIGAGRKAPTFAAHDDSGPVAQSMSAPEREELDHRRQAHLTTRPGIAAV